MTQAVDPEEESEEEDSEDQEPQPAPLAKQQPAPPTGDLSMMQVASAFAKSGYFPGVQHLAQAVVKMLAGKELGIPPVAAMQGVYIVQGRVGLSSNMIAALIKRSGRYDYRVKELTDQEAVLEFSQKGEEGWVSQGVSSFSIKDAQRAGIIRPAAPGKLSAWQAYPRNMLFARALTNGARWFCPDVFNMGPYTVEELEDAPEPTPTGEAA